MVGHIDTEHLKINTARTIDSDATRGSVGLFDPIGCASAIVTTIRHAAATLKDRCLSRLRASEAPPSILRNNTNLPVFLVLAIGISLVCNFALKESSAQASRYLSATATLQDVRTLLANSPDDPSLHLRLADLYTQQGDYRKALFHYSEFNRLSALDEE